MLEIKILAGAESKAFLTDLESLIKRMEAATGKTTKAAKPAVANTEEEESEDDDGDFSNQKAAKSTKKKQQANGFDEDAEEQEETEEAEETTKSSKKSKPKKLTGDDVNDACKEAVTRILEARGCTGKEARTVVLKLLKKHFKTESISEIDDQEDMRQAIALLSEQE